MRKFRGYFVEMGMVALLMVLYYMVTWIISL